MLVPEIVSSMLPTGTERVFIAYSGGVDSHVLLHLACQNDQLKPKITAVYVHHGLQQQADAWAEHCQRVSSGLGVRFLCLSVNAQKLPGQSQEEAARDARYQAFESLLQQNDVLLLGQHREDQLETVLLQLFRGAGVRGLSGMPKLTGFATGRMGRPFLDISKQEINDYAEQNGLQWIEDPSNKSDEFDRNFLRNQIVPQLKQRWPSVDKTIARSARHCAISHQLQREWASTSLEAVYDDADKTLNISSLLDKDIHKQYLLIRQWFAVLNLRMPSETNVSRIVDEVLTARKSANPQLIVGDRVIRRYRNKLYCLKKDVILPEGVEQNWPTELKSLTLTDGSILSLQDVGEGVAKTVWDESEVVVKYRQGAEKLRLPGRAGRHTLKKLFQEKGIPQWERSRMPLIYLNGQLAAVADLWISAGFFSVNNGVCYRLNWRERDF